MGEKPEGFTIVDRRRVGADGEARPDTNAAPSVPKPTSTGPASPASEGLRDGPEAAGEGKTLPPVEFAQFILSLAGSIQIGLGLIPNPATGKPEQNLPMARQTIDLLGMLAEKTKGNLTAEEAELLEELLYTLRMQYVDVNKGGKGTV